jgi:hypothetical protein
MSVGGKGLQWCNEKLAQAQRVVVVISSDEDEGEKRQDKKPPVPRRSLRLIGVKRKNYIEHTQSRRIMQGTAIGRAPTFSSIYYEQVALLHPPN